MPDRIRPKELPRTVDAFNRHRELFEMWLIERGSAVKEVTNPYEVTRFTGRTGECIVYAKSNGTISHWANDADKAYEAFIKSTEWRAVRRGKRNPKRTNLILSLAKRDGWSCVYCGRDTGGADTTIEHFVSVTSGGDSHMANLSLAHGECNRNASHLSVREKFEMALNLRREVDDA